MRALVMVALIAGCGGNGASEPGSPAGMAGMSALEGGGSSEAVLDGCDFAVVLEGKVQCCGEENFMGLRECNSANVECTECDYGEGVTGCAVDVDGEERCIAESWICLCESSQQVCVSVGSGHPDRECTCLSGFLEGC